MKKLFVNAVLFGALVGLSGCDENQLSVDRTAATPMTAEINDLKVNVYRQEMEFRQDPSCGYDTAPPNNLIPRSCWVRTAVLDRQETIHLRVHFPAGSELTGSEKETFKGEFMNDYEHPELNYGELTVKVRSRANNWDKDSMKHLRVEYGVVTDIYPQLDR